MTTRRDALLDDSTQAELDRIGRADLLVGIPSFNNERTIGHVVRAAQYGLAKYYPRHRAVVLNADGGSTDGTRARVRKAMSRISYDTLLMKRPVHPSIAVSGLYRGLPGKGSAFRAFFQAARDLDVKCLVVLDSDLRSITPEWVEVLAGPVLLKGYDLVTPRYARHKFDGTITNHVVYPMVRTLYGKRIRQPIGGDFGLGPDLVKALLAEDVWGTDVARFGIDIYTTATAITKGFDICESFLGAKIHDPKDPASGLTAMFTQVVGTLFRMAHRTAPTWHGVWGSESMPRFGFQSELAPLPVEVSVQAMMEKFQAGVVEHRSAWGRVLDPDDLEAVQAASRQPMEDFRFPPDLWARCIFAHLARAPSGSDAEATKAHLAGLVPLYLGRTAAFVQEAQDLRTVEAERLVEEQGATFEALKPYLMQLWDQRPKEDRIAEDAASASDTTA